MMNLLHLRKDLLYMNKKEILPRAGSISLEKALEKAHNEYFKYRENLITSYKRQGKKVINKKLEDYKPKKDNGKKVVSLPEVVGKGYKTFWNFKGRYRVVKGSRASKKSKTLSSSKTRNSLLVSRYSHGAISGLSMQA